MIPSATDVTCHLDCVCDENEDLQSVQDGENVNHHNIIISEAVDNLEEQQCECNTEITPHHEATSVKEECDCKPFCSCNSDSVNSTNPSQTVDSNNYCKKLCECGTICYCEKQGSFCQCCFCNRIGSSLANVDNDNISSGMKLSQCGCESLCECLQPDLFSVDYMKELEDLRQKTDDVYESSCKLDELKETFRELGSFSEPCDFFTKPKFDEQVDELEESTTSFSLLGFLCDFLCDY